MPDFCDNSLGLTHISRSKLEEALTAYTKGQLLSYFAPVPENGDHCEYWGTKWDIWDYEQNWRLIHNELYLTFSTAWGPPSKAYYAAVEQHGFQVEGYFQLPGEFCGVIIPNERELEFWYRKGDEIPQDIDSNLYITDEWEEDDEDNDIDDDYDEVSDRTIQFRTRDIAPPYELKDFSNYLTAWLNEEPIGHINDDGYRVVNIDGRDYYMHDLVCNYITGGWPRGKVEHVNGKKDDNRWSNLRLKE